MTLEVRAFTNTDERAPRYVGWIYFWSTPVTVTAGAFDAVTVFAARSEP